MHRHIGGEHNMKLSGCVILYNPDEDVWENVNTYLDCLNILYVIDNSDACHKSLKEKIRKCEKCKYITMHGNKGMAAALNRAAACSLHDGYKWLLTMDQDSRFPAESLRILMDYIAKLQDHKIGIVCGRYQERVRRKAAAHHSVTYPYEAITSGSIIRTDVWKKLGGYLNELFIDEVDNEYCFRLILGGYRIARVNDAVFCHQLGNAQKKHGYITRNYSPVRYYYIIRNTCYVIHAYQDCRLLREACACKRRAIVEWIEKVWQEEDRLKKYLYMLKGYMDFKRGNMGKCRWNL